MNARARALAFLLLAVCGAPAHAKCAPRLFRVIISAYDGKTQTGVSGATVSVFANNETESWPTDYVKADPIVTDSSGAFSGTFYFNTYSGNFLGMDRCGGKLKKLEVVLMREGYRPARISINPAKAVTSSTPAEVTIRVPAIELQPVK